MERQTRLTVHEIARMIDLSSVRPDVDLDEVHTLAETAKRFQCVCTYVLPCFLSKMKELLADDPDVGVGGAVGFPSGGVTTNTKAAEARELISLGADEIDMVINIGMLRSGRDRYVEDDIRAVVDASQETPVKVILETHYLDDSEIRRGSLITVQAGAAFVKTGTGWPETGATLHNVRLIRETVGDSIRIKASGGIRSLELLLELYRRGATRFGIGLTAGTTILEEVAAMPDASVDVFR